MKNLKIQILSIVILISVIISLCVFCNVKKDESINSSNYLRLHIRANSNSLEDQNVKYKIKSRVVDLISPLVINVKTKLELENILRENEAFIESKVNEFLIETGFTYGCDMEINNEFFPTRTYEDLTLEADYYDALIINLGSGNGNNWWCVIYPPICFVGENHTDKNIVYKSRLWEIINKFFD